MILIWFKVLKDDKELFVCGNRRIPIRVFATDEEFDGIGA